MEELLLTGKTRDTEWGNRTVNFSFGKCSFIVERLNGVEKLELFSKITTKPFLTFPPLGSVPHTIREDIFFLPDGVHGGHWRSKICFPGDVLITTSGLKRRR